MGRKLTRKGLVKKLDKAVSEYVIKRDKQCVICGKKSKLGAGHLFSRTSYSLRWDIRDDGNVHCQCWGCNLRHEYDPYPYNNWYIEKFGKKKWDKLHNDWFQVKKFSDADLQKMLEKLTNN